jgi:queuine tRNA-ribosyltransferase
MRFDVEKKDGHARAGLLETSRSIIETPAYMPCATIGAVKAVRWSELEELDFRVVLMNALHLYLRPGVDVVKKLGQIHDFTTWNRSILTDSGGYQFFSLKGLYNIDDDGVSFQSPYDGSRHRFTPESVVELQIGLGSDIIMPLDHCAPGDASRDVFIEAGERTLAWLQKAADRYRESSGKDQALFGIIQGGTHVDLRKEYVNKSAELNLDGYALGGISVGEDKDEGDQIVNLITPLMPDEKPRYLMGVGLPGQILDGIESGIDLFDCVLPTRMARNGTLFTSRGRLNLRNSRFISEHEPLDTECSCATCRKYSRAYLSHLHKVGEPGVLGLLSLHNLAYYRKLVSDARKAIKEGRFSSWKNEIIIKWGEGV